MQVYRISPKPSAVFILNTAVVLNNATAVSSDDPTGRNYAHVALFIGALKIAVNFAEMLTLIAYDVESAQWSHVFQ